MVRCDLSIIDGDADHTGVRPDEEHDTLESKLIARIHCKHGKHIHAVKNVCD
jgi:cell cycle checkpoint control protein RAD9A